MAEEEEEVNYASVVFKAGNNPPPAAKRGEETVYGELKVQNETKNEDSAGRRRFQHLACCLGILCVILLGGIIGVCVYQVQELTTQNKELENQKKNLKQKIQNLTTNWNELSISRAQWNIDSYCLGNTDNKCQPCQKGWTLTEPSCYAYNDAEPANQKTWEEAQEDCRGKNSDLAVAHNSEEKEAIKKNSFGSNGFWIGLRVEDGKWKWVDGSDLTESSWIDPPADGRCALIFKGRNTWSSVSCGEKHQWICQKKALSV
ncbi:C-type lectin domain family 10 member A-like isoform X3 [Gymnodraco acuticeps]|uniref:C-type lectin domain family 10 member A-like isoform X3 n=1 Tax=Gymnodraco acuticeps TaxID=8218 RepID=A0A6P8T5J9_GYMAC|nr:C-type lectin domain family 10 member A-like isoform X3 [Gymnodraco acuticeps]